MRQADRAYDELLPLLRVVIRKLSEFHIAPPEKTQLAIMVASYFFGHAGAAMGEDRVVGARKVADLVVEAIRAEKPMKQRLRVVNDASKNPQEPSPPGTEAKTGK